MEAGRELDALVAEKVMGWERSYFSAYRSRWLKVDDALIPAYSTDIRAAWHVWERLTPLMKESHGGFYQPDTVRLEQDIDGYTVGFVDGSCLAGEHAHVTRLAEADTAPLAICKAALRACGVEVPS